MYTNILVPTDERSLKSNAPKPRYRERGRLESQEAQRKKHDILLLNTLSSPFSYSDSARASRQTFQQTSESTKCKRHLKSNSKA
jgi:hypothetical protein